MPSSATRSLDHRGREEGNGGAAVLDLAFDDVNRLALVLGLVVLLVAVAVVVYLGATACPPPDWAFWRFTGEGRVNFACVA